MEAAATLRRAEGWRLENHEDINSCVPDPLEIPPSFLLRRQPIRYSGDETYLKLNAAD